MPRVTESSGVTTLRELSVREDLALAVEERREREWRERQLAENAREAERRARWAEEDRHLALVREREQHAARLLAMQQAAVERVRAEAEAKFEQERLRQVHAHERSLFEMQHDARLRLLRRGLWGALAVALAAVLALVAVAAHFGTQRTPATSAELRELQDLRSELARARAKPGCRP